MILKRTKLNVSKLCFGTGRFKELTSEEGGKLLAKAYKKGINFWDTSDNYDSHRHIKEGLKRVPRKKIVLMSKITNVFDNVQEHVKKMLKECGTSYFDIVLLHAVDSEEQLKKYLSIIPELKKCKIKHIGISSHKPKIIEKIAHNNDIEFVLAPLNYRGFRIKTNYLKTTFITRRRKMIKTLKQCRNKDIYLIKIFGAGKIKKIKKAIKWGLKQKFADGIDLGITNEKELEEDVEITKTFLNQL